MRFFVEIEGRSQGPFTVEQVEALHGAGRINRSTRCRPEGKGEWSSIYNLVPTAIWVTSPVHEPVRFASLSTRSRKISENAVWIGASIIVALLIFIPIGGMLIEELGRKDEIEQARTPAPPPPTFSDVDSAKRSANHIADSFTQSLDHVVDEMAAAHRREVALTAVFSIIGLILFAFWLWMLVQVVTKEPEGNDKVVWTLVVVFTGPIGAAIYFIVRYMNRDASYAR